MDIMAICDVATGCTVLVNNEHPQNICRPLLCRTGDEWWMMMMMTMVG